MKNLDRWMLPDGIEDVLPDEAWEVEGLRRRLLDLFGRWGYDLIMPPMVEFTDSLLIGLGQDLDLQTFKFTDQLSGRTLGLRADITPQAARIDAHSLRREGVSRLCYAGHVLYTRPKTALAPRNPLQLGVELFGDSGLAADLEVISLLLAMLREVDLNALHIDLGHVGLFKALAERAALSVDDQQTLFDLLQAKAVADIEEWVSATVPDPQLAQWLTALPRLAGGPSILDEARRLLAGAGDEVQAALEDLAWLAKTLAERYPEAHLYFDLSELRGYHYHTGIVFAAFAPGWGDAIATGGRYDHIGEVFGRARAATGFSANLLALRRLVKPACPLVRGIFVPCHDETALQWQAIEQLRRLGERVIHGAKGQLQPFSHQGCDRQLIWMDGGFVVKPLAS
jgi:ATP phosphoribosyltransferase regulatory subunit